MGLETGKQVALVLLNAGIILLAMVSINAFSVSRERIEHPSFRSHCLKASYVLPVLAIFSPQNVSNYYAVIFDHSLVLVKPQKFWELYSSSSLELCYSSIRPVAIKQCNITLAIVS